MDRLSALPTEILFKIVEIVVPKKGRMIIGYDGLGTSATGIQQGSLNILRVSKLVSAIALKVLYSYRRYELAVETELHRRIAKGDAILIFFVCGHYIYNMRFQRLLDSIDKHPRITTPTDWLALLLRHTPAQLYWTNLKININQLVAADLGNGRLIRALQHARGLQLLEVELLDDVPYIMWFVRQLAHIQTIKLFSGKVEVFPKKMAIRNGNWKETLQQGKRIDGWY
ncbi:hypothetical protein BDR22DRAFT_838362 [Usnea florida]